MLLAHVARASLLLVCVLTAACRPSLTDLVEVDVLLPPPVLDLPASTDGTLQTAVFAGGCFWGVEAVFEHVRGVRNVVSGYAGGSAETAVYDIVSTGLTEHAESVEILFDPREISYGKLLQVFFSVAHDPTQIGGQFPDYGPQYRSEVFFGNAEEQSVASAYIAQVDATNLLRAPIKTHVSKLPRFYPAEEYHQDYLRGHLSEAYIIRYDLPKLEKLMRLFPELYQS